MCCRDRGFYKLHAFVIMPDHLHILLTPGEDTTIEKAVQMIKGGSARRIGVENPHRFPTWHAGFHDRWVRNAVEYQEIKLYIERNPLGPALVEKVEEYEFGSASGRYSLDCSKFDKDQVRG